MDLSLDVIERVLAEPELAGWNGFGVVVQAYGPRAAFVIDWLYALARKYDRTIMGDQQRRQVAASALALVANLEDDAKEEADGDDAPHAGIAITTAANK